ncbi:F-box/kelch-repeat protein At3g06240-like [Lotus japonicus]|uniref:F-box/kelch-repeat protein At3g06240-like n=1 Tax=Lotus japonicus TaxID=34305 RepID=UPI00258740C2|nr:F-box/kelch-repeat protein At3g06240-like [Lotus japonicus]
MMNEQGPRSTEEENPSLSPIVLPDELIVAILVRLPVSSLLRFKCVSKLWLSLISDTQFAKSHFDLAASPTHRLLLNCTHQLQFQSLDIDSSPPNNESALLQYLRQEFHGYGIEYHIDFHPKLHVLGSCRGFLLLLSPNQNDFIVSNPSTGVQTLIPSSTSFRYSRHSQYGIGYDESTDDYLLVSINSFTIDLFSLKTNLPCSLPLDHEYQLYDYYFASPIDLFLHGSLHWLVTSSLTKLSVVLAFDLVGKSLSEIALSPDLALKRKPYHFIEMTGCLGLCPGLCYSGNLGIIEIWIMKEYKLQSSWTKIVFSTHDILSTPRFFPICFTKCGHVFGSDEAGRFFRVNDKGKLLAVWPLDWKSNYRLLHSRMYTPSLLSLPS